MKIIEKNIAEIKPYENNPRNNDDAVQYVANSIKEFGWKVPIVIDKDGVIVAGHTRYKAAQQLGIDVIPCVIADDLTEEQIKAYRIADNKTADKAVWDDDLLKVELLDLGEEFDMTDFGFGEFELDILKNDYKPDPDGDSEVEDYGDGEEFLKNGRVIITYKDDERAALEAKLGITLDKVLYRAEEILNEDKG